MKIAVFHELHAGGARRCVNEFSYLLKKKHQIDLYIVDEKRNKAEERFFTRVFFYRFIPKQWKGRDWKTRIYKDSIELYKLYRLHKQIAKEINEKQYDIVFVNPSRFTQAPFLLQFLHSPSFYYCMEPLRIAYDSLVGIKKNLDRFRYWYEKINRGVRKVIDKKNLDRAQYYLTPSKYRARLFSSIYHKQSHVVYCGVDTERFKPANSKKDIDILYIGSHDIIDGYDTFLQAMDLVKNKPTVRTILVDEEWIADDRVLHDIYQRSKVFVCTARKEGLGLATLEAMSCGAAVVAVDEAGHKETVIDKKTGYLVPRNSQKIAEKINWLLTHPKELSDFSKKSRESAVSDWSWRKRTQQLEKLLLEQAHLTP